MPSEADTKVVGSRITADQLHRVQAIAKELTRRAAGAPVAVAQVVAIMVGRDLPSVRGRTRPCAASSQTPSPQVKRSRRIK